MAPGCDLEARLVNELKLDGSPGDVCFVNGLIIDGSGGLIDRGHVVVSGGVITHVASGTPPASVRRDTEVVDLEGRILMPGLIDTHVHLSGDGTGVSEQESLASATIRTVMAAQRTLASGMTTVRTAGTRDFIDVDVRDAIRSGHLAGPRIIASGPALTVTGGHLHQSGTMADGVDEVRKAVRTHLGRGVDSLKLVVSGGLSSISRSLHEVQFTDAELSAAVEEAHSANRRVLTHAVGQSAIRAAVRAGVNSIDHGNFLDEESAILMREKRIFLVPTFSPWYYYTVRTLEVDPKRLNRAAGMLDAAVKSFAMALDLGVPIAMGCDCGGGSGVTNGDNTLELELMVKYGMSAEDAVVAATSGAAELLGISDCYGRIATGMVADLIVVRSNPIDNIRALRRSPDAVYLAGKLVTSHDLISPDSRVHGNDTVLQLNKSVGSSTRIFEEDS